MEWQGYSSVASMVEELVRDAVLKNPGPMRSMSVRLPVSHEARLVVLSQMLGVPKSALLRDLLMSALLEAEDKLFGDIFEGNEETRSGYLGRVEQYRQDLEEGADHRPGEPELVARVKEIRKVEEGEAK